MSVLHRTRADEWRHHHTRWTHGETEDDGNRVPPFDAIRDTVRERTGPAADFDWGAPLRPMTMTEIAAMPAAAWEYSDRDDARAAEDIAANLAAIRDALAGPAAHTARMLLLPVAARIADLLGSTWDHRPLGVAIGHELGAEETGAEVAV